MILFLQKDLDEEKWITSNSWVCFFVCLFVFTTVWSLPWVLCDCCSGTCKVSLACMLYALSWGDPWVGQTLLCPTPRMTRHPNALWMFISQHYNFFLANLCRSFFFPFSFFPVIAFLLKASFVAYFIAFIAWNCGWLTLQERDKSNLQRVKFPQCVTLSRLVRIFEMWNLWKDSLNSSNWTLWEENMHQEYPYGTKRTKTVTKIMVNNLLPPTIKQLWELSIWSKFKNAKRLHERRKWTKLKS